MFREEGREVQNTTEYSGDDTSVGDGRSKAKKPKAKVRTAKKTSKIPALFEMFEEAHGKLYVKLSCTGIDQRFPLSDGWATPAQTIATKKLDAFLFLFFIRHICIIGSMSPWDKTRYWY